MPGVSKASEWAKSFETQPRVEFRSPDGQYRVRAAVGVLFNDDPDDDDVVCLALKDSCGAQIGLRQENALDLARWILATFGEEQP